jgi:hypothetical protein
MVVAERPIDTEYEIAPELQDELLKHPGKWVAMSDVEILAVADTADEAFERAVAAGQSSPTLYRVPTGGESYFF